MLYNKLVLSVISLYQHLECSEMSIILLSFSTIVSAPFKHDWLLLNFFAFIFSAKTLKIFAKDIPGTQSEVTLFLASFELSRLELLDFESYLVV